MLTLNNKKLNEKLATIFSNRFWFHLSRITLSEDFIREFQNKVSWYLISKYQKLSEDFIREFQDKVYWDCICRYQNLSEDFIREFQDKVSWHQKLYKDLK